MFAGSLTSNTCAPPLPYGLSIPGEQVEPGSTTPPPRSSVTNMNPPVGSGSASWETETPSLERTKLLLLQFVTGTPSGCGYTQSRPGWSKVPRKVQPSADGDPGPAALQSVTMAAVWVP